MLLDLMDLSACRDHYQSGMSQIDFHWNKIWGKCNYEVFFDVINLIAADDDYEILRQLNQDQQQWT